MSGFNDPYRTPSTPLGGDGFSGVSPEEKNWALIAHLSPLLGYVVPVPFFNVLAPIGVWFLKRDKMPFVDDQAREAINFQITMLIASLICLVLAFIFFIGVLLAFPLLVYSLVMMAIAAKAAQEGRRYRFPFCLRFF